MDNWKGYKSPFRRPGHICSTGGTKYRMKFLRQICTYLYIVKQITLLTKTKSITNSNKIIKFKTKNNWERI